MYSAVPAHTPEDFFVFTISAAAEGLVAQLPPGRPLLVPGTPS
jgi:hypothetical protein